MQNSNKSFKLLVLWVFILYSAVVFSAGVALGGVGISVRLEEDGSFRISEIVSGSPAEKVGLIVGEEVKGVDGVSTSRKTLEEVVNLIRGTEGTCVLLSLKHTTYPNLRHIKVRRYILANIFASEDCI
ncbi:MAG: PDZ domain-containing protein [Pseudomonadota bacterium]|nr:PDZ domain-containing protein [Pseudomonadota bacterium]